MSSISLEDYKRLVSKKHGVKRKKKRVGSTKQSTGEETLAIQLKALKIAFSTEYKFHETRKWRADFHLTSTKILIEVEGGIWIAGGGRHNRGKGFIDDMEKYNTAAMLGYQVLRFSTDQVSSGVAIEQIEKVLKK